MEVENIFKKVFSGFSQKYLKGQYYSMVGMPEAQRKKLVDQHYLYINDDPCLEAVTYFLKQSVDLQNKAFAAEVLTEA